MPKSISTREPPAEAQALFTLADYARMPDDLRCQLIEGCFVKEPAPILRHQIVVTRVFGRLLAVLGDLHVVASPVDVVLDDHNVLQPDVAAFRAPLDIDARWAPVPDVVLEVLSPATSRRDRGVKSHLYVAHDVQEVWLVDPVTGAIDIHTTEGVTQHGPDETVRSRALPEIELRGADLVA